MNELELKLSTALDAVTALEESMKEFHADVLGHAPIHWWEELARSIRYGVEGAVAAQQAGRVTRIAGSVKKRLAG